MNDQYVKNVVEAALLAARDADTKHAAGVQVELADGTVGWAPAGRIARVEGPPPG